MIESRQGEEEAEDGLSLKATFSEKLFDVAPLSASPAVPEPGRVLTFFFSPFYLGLHY